MGGTGPGTQQALHKYLMNARARQRAFPERLPRTGSAIGVEARPAGRAIWLLGEPAGGGVEGLWGNAEELNCTGRWAALGEDYKRCRTASCLDYGCFN